jgi:two-component system cell cycle sensor histidine kinase/response regulator CckA
MSASKLAPELTPWIQDQLRVVSEAARTFAEATTDYERLLDSVARNLSDVIKDSCCVFLLSDDGSSMRAASLHANDPAALEQIRKMFLGRPLRLVEQPALKHILDTGEALLVPQLDPVAPRSDTTQEQVSWQRRLGLHSFLVVALRAHGRPIGVLSMGRFRPTSPPFNQEDRDLAQNLADLASLAIENAQLFASAREARRAAEQAEERARRSEQTHRVLFESSPVATFVFDVETLQLLAVNPAALSLYGYTREEFLALKLADLRAPQERADLVVALRAVGDGEMAGSARHRRKDGSIVHVEGRNHLTSFEGRPARFVILQDHTERMRAAAALVESEGRLQRTLDGMLEGYTILSDDLRYLYVNDVAARQARMPKDQLLGRTPMELYPDFESTGMYALLQRCRAHRLPVRAEEELIHVDGSRGVFEVSVQPTPEGLVILSMDATERRRAAETRESLEEQLRQTQKMDAIGRLAGGVAHDFNNLLSVILGYGETILADLDPADPMRADVEEMDKAAQRAAELTKQLLTFSRQRVMETQVLDLNSVLGNLGKMLRRVLGEQNQLVEVLDPGLGPIRADRGHIEQVVMNLAVNARDAMPNGGTLTIETANVILDDRFVNAHLGIAPGAYVQLAVTDTGIGMDKATRLRIFEPFFTTKGHGRGTGLGLSTVFGIVQQSGGGIWVYSEPGHGTTFKVYLPRVEGTVDESARRQPAPIDLRGTETILLVEDEEAVRVVAQHILERSGYRVIAAKDPGDAIAPREPQADPIHLLLTDVVMPRMNGAELAARLGERWPEMKVLYMSGYTDGSVASLGTVQSSAAFLQKPFTSQSLALKVRSVLDGEGGSPV